MKTLVVLDTNVLVSAFWSENGTSSRVVQQLIVGKYLLCYDDKIMTEYSIVLSRERFSFNACKTLALLQLIAEEGLIVAVRPSTVAFSDESNRKFYNVAQACGAFLVTGNKKHFPAEPFVVSPGEFLSFS